MWQNDTVTAMCFWNHAGVNIPQAFTVRSKDLTVYMQGFPRHLRTLLVGQELPGTNKTAVEEVLASDTRTAELRQQQVGSIRDFRANVCLR